MPWSVTPFVQLLDEEHANPSAECARNQFKHATIRAIFAEMKRKSFATADCPVARALDAVGDWWSLLIVREALAGARRFGDFQRELGLAKNILATRLKRLVELEILKTAPAADGSAYSEYVLTEKGRSLFVVLVALRQWGIDWRFMDGEPYNALVDARDGKPLARLEVRSHDGRSLTPRQTRRVRLSRRSR
jgi:DNA-binding HxlR family transcriptional regulator